MTGLRARKDGGEGLHTLPRGFEVLGIDAHIRARHQFARLTLFVRAHRHVEGCLFGANVKSRKVDGRKVRVDLRKIERSCNRARSRHFARKGRHKPPEVGCGHLVGAREGVLGKSRIDCESRIGGGHRQILEGKGVGAFDPARAFDGDGLVRDRGRHRHVRHAGLQRSRGQRGVRAGLKSQMSLAVGLGKLGRQSCGEFSEVGGIGKSCGDGARKGRTLLREAPGDFGFGPAFAGTGCDGHLAYRELAALRADSDVCGMREVGRGK